jgi:bacterioferritin-associated ferredoxin
MIVCHCNRIEHTTIEAAAAALVAADPHRLLTPVGVYKALGKRPRCGGCLALAADIIHGRCPNNGDCRTCPLAGVCEGADEVAPSVAVVGVVMITTTLVETVEPSCDVGGRGHV